VRFVRLEQQGITLSSLTVWSWN